MKALLSFYWKARIVLFALRWVGGLNLGDHVLHDGKVWYLAQGVCRPRWTLRALDYSEDKEVREDDFRKLRTPANYWRSFRYGYWFYMTNWYGIWVNEGIKPWMRACNIWGRR